ncbi:MAG: hypothetical protein U0903_02320 [Planctomycetales bacterium]
MLFSSWLVALHRRTRFQRDPRSRRSRTHRLPLAAEISPLEARLLLAKDTPFPDPVMPSNHGSSPSDVMYYDASVPLKTITLYNNTDQTVYPILSDANSRTGEGTSLPLYDPFDKLNEEYRGYIGYSKNGVNYLGLRAHQSITINVPLVFWDGGRIDIGTDGTYMIPKSPTDPNPFFYHDKNADGTSTDRFAVPAIGPAATNGVIMWYHAKTPIGPGADAPTQLIEMTFRDPFLATIPTAPYIPASEKQKLVNYDVSYVDSILLPVAMEADNVPIPIPDATNTPKKTYGWIGAKSSYNKLLNQIEDFTSNKAANGLGKYFDGKGYDKYRFPNEALMGVKLPAGQNLIGHSPLRNVASNYNILQYMLTSGGDGLLKYVSGGFTTANSTTLKVVEKSVLKDLKPGMEVTSTANPSEIPAGTVITQVNVAAGTVTLSKAATKTTNTNVYVFKAPATDYVATKLTNLWYSWADYYANNHKSAPVNGVTASIALGARTLKFATPAPATLIPGMVVTGPGIPAGTIIMGISADRKSIDISKLATSAQTNAKFNFAQPALIQRSSEVKPFTLTFKPDDQATADKFASALYQVMHAMATIPLKTGQGTFAAQLMFNVLGCNVGFIPGIKPSGKDAVPVISNEIRDFTKSIMRGVYDFRAVPESTGEWYPDPSDPVKGSKVNGKDADYNVFNLNPFVWFVHVKLGLSGYGFSVDDDVADVGANGSGELLVSIGGLDGLKNKDEWTWGAPFGPVEGSGDINRNTYVNRIFNIDPTLLAQLNNEDPNVGPGALVTGPGIRKGTRIKSIDWGNHSVILDQTLSPSQKAGNYKFKFS